MTIDQKQDKLSDNSIKMEELTMEFTFKAYNDDTNLVFNMELSEFDEICIDTRVKFNDKWIEFGKLAEKLVVFDNILLVDVKVFDDLNNFDKVYDEWDTISQIEVRLEEGSECFTDIVKHFEKIQNWHYSESYDFEMLDLIDRFRACQKLFDNLLIALETIRLPDGF